MMKDQLLNGYRVLDLTDKKGAICGKLLADMGADVVKIEKPGGDDARNEGPFYKNTAHKEKSLFWWAYNTGKRSITLSLETADGKKIFQDLVKKADVVIESFDPGYMARLGLAYDRLASLNRQLIMVSISGFGQHGPYSRFKCDDLVLMSMGGMVFLSGDPDRPPVRLSVDQAFLHAGTQGVIGALIALFHRTATGRGQWVDVSAQEAIVWLLMNGQTTWAVSKTVLQRSGPGRKMSTGVVRPYLWPCKNGHIAYVFRGGKAWAPVSRALVQWMDENGMADQAIKHYPWESFDFSKLTPKQWDPIQYQLSRFFMAFDKTELYEGAIERGIPLYPAYNLQEVLNDRQLQDRNYWKQVVVEEESRNVVFPGAFAGFFETPLRPPCGPPNIGEHNDEIYCNDLGYSRHELVALKQAGVI